MKRHNLNDQKQLQCKIYHNEAETNTNLKYHRKGEHNVIQQLDGNDSICSLNIDEELNSIPVHYGFRPPQVNCDDNNNTTLKTIKRDNRGYITVYLPVIAVYNHRSIWNKLQNFILEAKETNQGLTFHSEVWEMKEKKEHRKKIEEMMEMEGIKYVSTARPGRRGGGNALTCNMEEFDMKEVQNNNFENHEVTFAIVRPKANEAKNIVIIT